MNDNHANATIVSQNTASNKPVYPTLSDIDAQKLTEALTVIHSVVYSSDWSIKGKGNGAGFPTFDANDSDQRSSLFARAAKALDNRQATQAEAVKQAARVRLAAVKAALDTGLAAHIVVAREELAAFDALPASMKAKLDRSILTTLRVSVASLASCFAQGVPNDQILRDLVTMGFKVSSPAKGAYSVVIALETKASPKAPTRTDSSDKAAE